MGEMLIWFISVIGGFLYLAIDKFIEKKFKNDRTN